MDRKTDRIQGGIDITCGVIPKHDPHAQALAYATLIVKTDGRGVISFCVCDTQKQRQVICGLAGLIATITALTAEVDNTNDAENTQMIQSLPNHCINLDKKMVKQPS